MTATWAPTETQKTIYDLLVNDTDLITLLGEGNVFDNVPQNHPYPYISLQLKPWSNRANTTWDGLDASLQINVWARVDGDLFVQSVQKRIDELLNNIDICVEGWDVISLRRTLIDIFQDPDGVTLHGVQTFNLKLGEN